MTGNNKIEDNKMAMNGVNGAKIPLDTAIGAVYSQYGSGPFRRRKNIIEYTLPNL